ncbi:MULTISPECIES: hypothetical protein [Syntrophotalea]|jgi:uncharacterized protein (DUF1778 family)|uniref:Uncharacterized protein n=1 Tax=Syntrophotalea acetylenica TaxID=29542 RepID=A0A1L3GIG0_SYNAC|nr:hypothetical protein [Syntrophotalea acetylenica]APG25722.1 hypothetical protein A7E75_12410 [Syntrophotalea acetylenica]APG43795.1 hypothetical protein A6070_06425 [Syntrophotalea acetylenica]MDY0263122.1 hypothetical protein [Syntrophotalea acetylenica]
MAMEKQINLRLDNSDEATLKFMAEAQGRSEQEILRYSFRKYAKEFLDQMNFIKSVERGWVELKSGLGEIVTEEDDFFDEIMKDINNEPTPS